MVGELEDERRIEPDFTLGERAMLEGWLEFHRMTLLLKCEGASDEVRKKRPVATSALSLHGLVRHMAEVERQWFAQVLLARPDLPAIWPAPNDEQREFELEGADFFDDQAIWLFECQKSREAAASRSLDDTGLFYDRPCSLRWIYLHMIEEYARHNGHADLLRELGDGAVGW